MLRRRCVNKHLVFTHFLIPVHKHVSVDRMYSNMFRKSFGNLEFKVWKKLSYFVIGPLCLWLLPLFFFKTRFRYGVHFCLLWGFRTRTTNILAPPTGVTVVWQMFTSTAWSGRRKSSKSLTVYSMPEERVSKQLFALVEWLITFLQVCVVLVHDFW